MDTDIVTVLVKKSSSTMQGCLDWANELVGNRLEPPHEWLIVTRIKQFQIIPTKSFSNEKYDSSLTIVVLVEANDDIFGDADSGESEAALGEVSAESDAAYVGLPLGGDALPSIFGVVS
jgi:hypothetical protein